MPESQQSVYKFLFFLHVFISIILLNFFFNVIFCFSRASEDRVELGRLAAVILQCHSVRCVWIQLPIGVCDGCFGVNLGGFLDNHSELQPACLVPTNPGPGNYLPYCGNGLCESFKSMRVFYNKIQSFVFSPPSPLLCLHLVKLTCVL